MVDKNTALNTGMQDGLKLDVAIVGAGISGIYSAYRLTTAGAKTGAQVQVFDMNTRIAGRLESVRLPGLPTVQGELGGMRYLTSQQIVTTLIEEVFADQMEAVEFPMGDPAKLFMYLRKDRCKQNAWSQAQANGEKLLTRYYLNDDDIGFSADQLFSKVIYDVLVADPWFNERYSEFVNKVDEYTYTIHLTLEQWDQIKPNLTYQFEGSPYDKRLVNDIGFWNLLKDQVSQEGYTFLSTGGGYYSNTINWNAAEAFPYMIGDFSATAVYKTIATGFDSTVYAMANEYMAYEGACIWTENKLLTFNKEHAESATHRYELVFLNLRTNLPWKVYANSLVLAMPRRSLQLLDQNNFFFNINQNTELNNNIRSVIMEPAFKILMGFDTPWWREELGITAGHSITDLPMRQCYYFGTGEFSDHSMLLGSYGDMDTQTFWKALSDDPVKFRPRKTRLASQSEVAALNDVQASDMMVKELVDELRELHGVGVPMPYITWFKDWADDPFGAGYHAWKAGYKVQDVMPYMRKPDENENIHICGEAYSDQQGWVEGAFCEAEKMLESYFGLSRPSWLSPSYYLGW
ncbi:MAG: FAD-dependent oxidoreductase [Pseudomonadota bacterium]